MDVHTHLTHDDFAADLPQVIAGARAAGVGAMVVNGLEPKSNRHVLAMGQSYPEVKPALGIYPLDAVNDRIPADFPFPVPPFSVSQELAFIRSQAEAGRLWAIGECGLDGYYLDDSTFAAQEKVFEELIDIAKANALPLIIHTRKLEQRAAEVLQHHKVERVNFHCFGGRVQWAKEWAEKFGWWFSLPANITVNQGFQKMAKVLPPERLLTETDAPYLAPKRGDRNEPKNVVGTIEILSAARGWTHSQAKEQVWTNFVALFQRQI